jgi:hypothetical protein
VTAGLVTITRLGGPLEWLLHVAKDRIFEPRLRASGCCPQNRCYRVKISASIELEDASANPAHLSTRFSNSALALGAIGCAGGRKYQLRTAP